MRKEYDSPRMNTDKHGLPVKPKKKTFDCVELQHRGAAIIQRKLRGMTREQELEYWRRRTEELREHQKALKTP